MAIAKISFPPHKKSSVNTQSIMLQVIIALMPALLVSSYLYGAKILLYYLFSIFTCVFFEYLFNKLAKNNETISDLSAVITGILLVMCMPPYSPLWLISIGSFVAIIVGKCVFGGLGQNPFNPAILGRTFLLLSFPAHMSTWTFVDQVSSATVLSGFQISMMMDKSVPMTTFEVTDILSHAGGSLGEASALAIIIGGIYLIYKRVITWHIPITFISTVFLLSFVYWVFNPSYSLDPFTYVFSGGLMLAAFFMATDYSSSPMFVKGKLIFGIGCGIITFLIRTYGIYPEGVAFSILIMNAFVPLLDRYFRPVSFGKKGE